jgi:predicted MFS family arabinose efflux permease
MFALAYGITRGGEHGWGDALTVGAFVAALLLGGLFVALQARREHPMLPLALFRDRNRSGSYATMLFVGAGLMGTFYLLTLYLQEVLHFSPVRTGLSSLPFSAGIILGAGISSKLVERLAPRAVAGPGLAVGAGGMFWLSVHSSYVAHVLPAVFLTSLGLGLSAVAMTLTAVHGVSEERAGVASAVVNMAQQLGAALGLAVFTTISLTAAETRLPDAAKTLHEGLSAHGPDVLARAGAALSHGYTTAFLSGAALLLLAAVVVLAAVTSRHTQGAAGRAQR